MYHVFTENMYCVYIPTKKKDLMRLEAPAARALKVTLVFEQHHALAARLEVEEEAAEEGGGGGGAGGGGGKRGGIIYINRKL
jgi:hypothetical protein